MLHIVYRSYGGENKKSRPGYYSKLLALMSFVEAVEELKRAQGELEVIYLNDGPIAADCLSVMTRTGEVMQRSGLRLRGSMRAALALPFDRGWAPDDIVWFAEDDYLYLPNAFLALVTAARVCPDASYFGLYAQIGSKLPSGNPLEENRVPDGWHGSEPIYVLGHPWFRALSTTSTFGGRVRALIEDRLMMQIAMMTGGAWDHSICLMYQGFIPYSAAALREWLRDARTKRSVFYCGALLAARIGLNGYQALRSTIGRTGKRILISPDPALITHLETIHMATGTDWGMVAAGTFKKHLAGPKSQETA
jgi:hypothetical protein